jgi:phospholipase C
MRSNAWESSAFMFLYDDWGGWYDHVVPPQVDEYGYGMRVPAFMVSPYARRGHIESTVLDFTSILKFIEENWNIESLAERDAKANNFLSAFDFTQPPRTAAFIPFERVVPEKKVEPRRIVIYLAYGGALVLAILMFFWTAKGADIRKQSLAYIDRFAFSRC